ncbi:hypothetical protein GMD78_20005 [Ornithinibacillus sp. L9]|uniref:DUF4871 domain-containing protein n=1 Tax=Ornithinibacillus caprae TaxID=2678566 RepID=A0A6N8FLY9_9BACI|nr:hypothetical protein [Ornithinibacillus caprae]MUK90642.1 hypothetical protein [Ornithinibacillus caprae]
MNQLNNYEIEDVFHSFNTIDVSEVDEKEMLSNILEGIDKSKKKKKYVALMNPILSSITIALFLVVGGYILYNKVILDDMGLNRGMNTEVEGNWEVTSPFTVEVDGVERVFRGVKGEVAFLDMELTAGNPGKTRWFFWGDDLEQLNEENFILVGIHRETGEEIILVDSNGWEMIGYPENDYLGILEAQSSQHTVITFPSSGLWRLDAYIGEKLFGTIVVEVKD